MDTRHRLQLLVIDLLHQLKNKPMAPSLASWLNQTYPAGSDLYDELSRLVQEGVEEG